MLPLALLATLALAIASPSAITYTVAPTTSTSSSYTSPAAFKDTILKAHNTYRHAHNASALTWNTTLASTASSHAGPCRFAHIKHNPLGEDLAAGYANTTAAVDSWGNEEKKYDYSDQGFSESTGHFTQVVWKGTRTVGCGATYCGGEDKTPGWYLVCEYWPAGDVQGQFKEYVQKAVDSGVAAVGVGGSISYWVIGVGLRLALVFW